MPPPPPPPCHIHGNHVSLSTDLDGCGEQHPNKTVSRANHKNQTSFVFCRILMSSTREESSSKAGTTCRCEMPGSSSRQHDKCV